MDGKFLQATMNVPVHKNLLSQDIFMKLKKGKKKKKRLFFLLQPSWPKGFYLNLTMSPMMTRSGIIRLFLTAQDIKVTKVRHKTQRGQVVLTRQINTASRTEDRAGVAGGGGGGSDRTGFSLR